MLRLLALVACASGCGASPPPREPDWGPPPTPTDPVACPAERLERFATRIGAPFTIANEAIVDAARIDKVPCRPTESDGDCVARARQRAVPSSYEVASVTIGGDGDIEYTLDIDGARVTEQAPSLELMVERIKKLQAAGHKIVVIQAGRDGLHASRHAAIAYRGMGGRQRRVATLRLRTEDAPQTMATVQDAAEHERIELRSMELDDKGELVITATCGAGGNS